MKICLITVAVFSFPLFFISCDLQKDGGSCIYDKDTIPATLITLVDINEKSYDALFEVDIEGSKDTISYAGKNNHHYIFSEETAKENLETGKQYQYIVQKIIMGTCAPEVDFILLKPFGTPQQ